MSPGGLALPVLGERFRLEEASWGELAVVRIADSLPVGKIELETAREGVVVRSLCIDEAYRSYGAGSEAALLLNHACGAANVPVVHSWAPPDRGLAVYFWIRMGYRPIHGEGRSGGIWFERRADPRATPGEPQMDPDDVFEEALLRGMRRGAQRRAAARAPRNGPPST